MSNVLQQAQAAAQQANWSLLNQCLQQLPLGKNASTTSADSAPLNQAELEDVLNLALTVLEAGDFRERWDVAKVLPKLGQRSIAPLIEILQDDEAELELRWFAGRILGEFNHPSVITALVELLKTAEDEELSAMAAEALTHLGEPAIDTLASLLADPESRLLATQSLSQIRRPEIITPLLGVVNDSSAIVRATAIEALSSFHDARIPPVLLQALPDPATAVRKEAVIGLGLRSDLWDELNLLSALKPLLYDVNLDVCQQAAIALGRSKRDEAAQALFEALQSPATPIFLQIALIRALGWVETPQTLDYFQQALTQLSGESVLEIIRVLGRFESPVVKTKAAQILIDFLNSQHPTGQEIPVKQALAQALGQLGDRAAMDALVKLLADAEDSVRLHAIAALKLFPNAHPQLQQLATDEQLTPALKTGVALALAEWQV